MRKLGFQIHYEYGESTCHYEPDFVVRLTNGTLLVLEIKGKAGELHEPDRVEAKTAAAKKWVAAVNNAKQYRTWAFEICRDLGTLRRTLARHAGMEEAEKTQASVLPFRRIERPAAADRFRTCVPLISLHAAAGYFSEEQTDIEGFAEWANEWIEWDTTTRFEDGMFVARVTGDSMEPEVPANSYCLFRQPRGGSQHGRRVLVWHEGVTDSETGGRYTLKVYTSEKGASEDGEWQHTRVVLKPLNDKYAPIVLTAESEGQVRVLAELADVIQPVTAFEA